MTQRGRFIICNKPGCDESIANHYWGKVKAEGWFFGKDGTSLCPSHVPEWYAKWRKRR